MNTSTIDKLSSNFIHDISNSDYEFNRYDKSLLKKNVSVLELSVTTNRYSRWKGIEKLFYQFISDRYLSNGLDVYCFIVSPYWKPNTKVTSFYGLGRSLEKDFDIQILDFLFEKEIIIDSEVLFYGVVKLTPENIRDIFILLSVYENGVLFSAKSSEESNFSSLISTLAKIISNKSKSTSFNLNIVDSINSILNTDYEALFPYAWEETGEYYMDVFGRKKG